MPLRRRSRPRKSLTIIAWMSAECDEMTEAEARSGGATRILALALESLDIVVVAEEEEGHQESLTSRCACHLLTPQPSTPDVCRVWNISLYYSCYFAKVVRNSRSYLSRTCGASDQRRNPGVWWGILGSECCGGWGALAPF